MQKLKSITALLFLFLFLFPQVEKGIHDFHHAADSHCGETTLHFCQAEHSCTFCAFQVTPVVRSVTPSFSFSLIEREITFVSLHQTFLSQEPKYTLPPRAPPIA